MRGERRSHWPRTRPGWIPSEGLYQVFICTKSSVLENRKVQMLQRLKGLTQNVTLRNRNHPERKDY